MTTLSHTVVGGQLPSSAYGQWGKTGGSFSVGPTRILAMIAGLPGSGKSHLVASCPEALLVNFDLSSSKRNIEAQIYPALSPSAQPIDQNGASINFNWELALALKDRLINATRNNEPRPHLLCLDSITAMIRMAKQHIGSNWENLGTVYDAVTNYILDLHHTGNYGVYVTAHFTKRLIRKEGDAPDASPFERISISHPDKLQDRLMPYLELLGVMFAEKHQSVQITDQTAVVNGVTRVIGKNSQIIQEARYYLSADPWEFPGIVKRRARLPERLVIPEVGGWATFEKAYNDANK